MRLGIVLPPSGPLGRADAVAEIARRAEQIGYDSIWIAWRERPLLAPEAQPGQMPDPLAVAAANTEQIGLGVTLANVPFASPIALVERLGRIERQSPGRLTVGLGGGSTTGELAAVLGALSGSTPASEFVAAFEALWTCSPDGFRGEYFVVSGRQAPCPKAGGRLPMALSMFSPAAVQPARALLDGADGLAVSPADAGQGLALLRDAVAATGPSGSIMARVEVANHASTAGGRRALLSGPDGQGAEDLVAIRDPGVGHLAIDVTGGEPDIALGAMIERMARFREIAGFAIERRLEALAA